MNATRPVCLVECQRLAVRTSWRGQLWFQRRRLRSAERQLGELGWQQAEFDPNDREITELRIQEQEQARLVFEIAEQKEQIAGLATDSAACLADLHGQIATAETDAARLEEHASRMARLLAAERARKAPLYLIESDEKALASDEATLSETRARLLNLQEILGKDEHQTRLELARLQAALSVMEKQLRDLQEKKFTHFAYIGHELADVGIAPMNQPGVLTCVLALREKITDLDFRLARSLSQSQPLSRVDHLGALALFTLLVLGAIFLILLGAWFGLKLHRR